LILRLFNDIVSVEGVQEQSGKDRFVDRFLGYLTALFQLRLLENKELRIDLLIHSQVI